MWARYTFLLAVLSLVACGGDKQTPSTGPWVGKRFLLDVPSIPSSNWSKPSGALVGNISNYGLPQILFGVEAGSNDDLVITLASARQGVQDTCAPTTRVGASDAAYPQSTIKTAQFPIRVVNKDPTDPRQIVTTIHDVSITNILPAPGGATSGQLSGDFDFAELATFLDPNGSVAGICQMAAASGSACQACTFNETSFCMPFELVNVVAVETTASISQVASQNIPNSCLVAR